MDEVDEVDDVDEMDKGMKMSPLESTGANCGRRDSV